MRKEPGGAKHRSATAKKETTGGTFYGLAAVRAEKRPATDWVPFSFPAAKSRGDDPSARPVIGAARRQRKSVTRYLFSPDA